VNRRAAAAARAAAAERASRARDERLVSLVLDCGFTITEAAAELGVSHQAVQNRLKRQFAALAAEESELDVSERALRLRASVAVELARTVPVEQRLDLLVATVWPSRALSEVSRERAQALRFAAAERSIAVLDTNVLLHHRPLSDVDWPSIVGAKSVLLVVPLRVVHELDARKYVGTKGGDRARTRIRLLSEFVAAGADQVRAGVDVEVVASVDLDPGTARRPPIPADTEILETCEALRAYAGSNPVYLVTADLAMQIVAKTRGIDVRRMPDEAMQPLGDEPN
jgi:rRNA maturation endonuclease Nob1/predicted DNA-binding protein YlxM (UPF0122 family)